MTLLHLFYTFMKIGFVSFGGGYAMIPVIEQEASRNGWMSISEFTDVIAIAGMSPGPMAVNSVIFVGYHTAGLAGAIVSAAGMVVPSLLLVILVATCFYKVNENRWVRDFLYGLRAVVTALIFYGAIRFAQSNGMISHFDMDAFLLFTLFVICLFVLVRTKVHPLLVIVASGVVGVIIF
ncbi:chromate transporter [Paenibacillus albiflavus]|uniref:Chromate transporter n=1 Tax=Paenibacillus albiflavus TaxID=2545760 RepID=A0A4R4E7N5_9BACL|nr:chromate transporter [Paenibacillus albiflavus]TCZ73758.1 chromate transporter [Paenibacillus albiflavus]